MMESKIHVNTDVDFGSYSFSVNTTGAYLSSLHFKGSPILKTASDNKETHGGCAQLIPFANRIRNAQFTVGGREVKLEADDPPHAIHGLIRHMEFDLTKSEKSVIAKGILSNNHMPWKYGIEITYEASGNTFAVRYQVDNLSEEPAPLMIGAHPYFAHDGDWKIESSNLRRIICEDNYFPNGRLSETMDTISPSGMEYDTPYLSRGDLRIHLGDHSIAMRTENMPYFMLYSGKYCEGSSIAVEPMTGAPDCFNNGMGLIKLKPQEKFHCSFSLTTEWVSTSRM